MKKKWHQTWPEQRAPDDTFVCKHCGQRVSAVAPGARRRSHCPHCLWSLHVEAHPAGAKTDCRGAMEPVGVSLQPGGEWSLVHRCRQCEATLVHSVAVDDNGAELLSVGVRPTRTSLRL